MPATSLPDGSVEFRPQRPSLALFAFIAVAIVAIAGFNLWRERDNPHVVGLSIAIGVVMVLGLLVLCWAVLLPKWVRLTVRGDEIRLSRPLSRTRVVHWAELTRVRFGPVVDSYDSDKKPWYLILDAGRDGPGLKLMADVWTRGTLEWLAARSPVPVERWNQPRTWADLAGSGETRSSVSFVRRHPTLFTGIMIVLLLAVIVVGVEIFD